MYIEHDLLWHINKSLTSGRVCSRWWQKPKKRGGMKKNCTSPEILGKRPHRPTEPSSTYLFRLDTPWQVGGEREGESDHCRMQHRACHRFVPFDFLLAVTLFLNITVFVHVHSCVLGAFWLSLFLPPVQLVCVYVPLFYLRAFGMEAVLPSFYPIARLAKGKFIVLSMVWGRVRCTGHNRGSRVTA